MNNIGRNDLIKAAVLKRQVHNISLHEADIISSMAILDHIEMYLFLYNAALVKKIILCTEKESIIIE